MRLIRIPSLNIFTYSRFFCWKVYFVQNSKRMEHMNITCLPEKKAHNFSSWRVIAIVTLLNILRCYLHTHTVGNIDVNGPATHKKMTAFFRALHCQADNKSIHFTVKFEVSINDMRLQWEHIVGFWSHFIAPKAFVVAILHCIFYSHYF